MTQVKTQIARSWLISFLRRCLAAFSDDVSAARHHASTSRRFERRSQ